ncbi:MAG: lysine 2,3-aminomutase [Gemmatimonadetes bacterium]|nr:MAG: lysine 2,3-aminomutase [Gemmatimonadota bacterium]
MSDWQKILHEGVDTLEKLANRFGHDVIDVEALKPAFDNFQMRITPAALAQIKEVGDPMWNQYVPTVQELEIVDGVIDSLDEDGDSPVPNITHRYPDRALFLVSPVCATYCRFCTRRRKVGDPEKIPLNQYDSAFAYLAEHAEIRDVILSGGDPMMLSDRRLEYIFQQLRAIPHIEIIRIGSRITSHLPERITPEFCEMVRKYHPVYMNTHFNHPSELTPDSVAALEIVKALRGWTSGLAVPHFVIDAPGGGGKVPLLPEYVEEITEDEVIFRNYEGKRFVYKQPRQVAAESGCDPLAPAAQNDVVPIQIGKKAASRSRRRRKTGS